MAVPTPPMLTFCIGAGLIICGMLGMWRLRQHPAMAAALLPAAWTLPVLFSIISLAKPILLARYWLWSGPPFAILAGIGMETALQHCRPSRRYGALAAVALLLLVNLGPFYRTEIKPRWDLAAELLAAQARPQDVAYYYDLGGGRNMRYYLPAKLQTKLLRDDTGNLRHAERALAQGKRVWAIYGDALNGWGWKSLADFKATLAPLGTPSVELHAGSRITLWRYDPVKARLASTGE